MSDSIRAKGTLLQVETSESSGVYATIPNCKDISGPSLDSGEYDDTTHSTSGAFKAAKAGLVDTGSVSTTVNYVPGNTYHNQLMSDLGARTERNYKLVYPNAKFFAFRAFVKAFPPAAPVDGLLTAPLTLRVVAEPTFPA